MDDVVKIIGNTALSAALFMLIVRYIEFRRNGYRDFWNRRY